MSQMIQTYSFVSTTLKQWVDARMHLSNAIQAYVSATTSLESVCTPFSIKSTPGILEVIENNLEVAEREEFELHRTQAVLKKKRNSYISPIYTLPSELLAYVFTTAVGPTRNYASNECVKRDLSRVCSLWCQIALDICPLWVRSSLTFRIGETLEDKMAEAEMELGDSGDMCVNVPIHRQPGLGDTPYIRKTLDEIAPYIKQLHNIDLAVSDVQQLRLLLDLWLEKGAPGSVTELNLAVGKAAPVFAEANPRLSDRFSQCLRHVLDLSLHSVGLDWTSVALEKLSYMTLSNLPSSCCPTLAQLARVLSTCPDLQFLELEHITFPVSIGPAPEPAELGRLQRLYLTEVDLGSVFSIISPKGSELHLTLRSAIDDIGALELLLSFARRVSIQELDLTFSETRSDWTLVRLLHPVSSPLLGLRRLALSKMNLRDSELSELAIYSFVHDTTILASASAGTTSAGSQPSTLKMSSCTIHTSPEVLHNAFASLSWHRLVLYNCHHSLTAEGTDSATEALVPIKSTSEFGIRLSELLPDRVEFYYW
ncbi:hypothetical protein BDV93DRAFT_606368 [Ceratobasidium sp. AG-I]|nr:hypothetical protein BDV93DRAFT_606368 [Ceratobasidium sp. AG-I]